MTRSAILAGLLSLTPRAVLAADAASPPPPSSSAFERSFSFGVQAGTLAGNGELPVVTRTYFTNGTPAARREHLAWESSGQAVSGNVGYHFAPAWTAFAGYEFGRMDGDHAGSVTFFSHAPHVGVRLTTNRQRAVGFILEMGAGYRVLAMDRGPVVHKAMGFDPFRVGVGATILATRSLRINVMFSVAVGQLTTLDSHDLCVNPDANRCQDIPGGQRRLHAFRTLTVGGTFDL